jgi:prephenate dehydrogenase
MDLTSNPSFIAGRIGIVGLGLMGGSFAKAEHAAGHEVYAWNRTPATLELAMVETVDGPLTDEAISTCELIVLAGYPQFSIDWLSEKAPLISAGAIVIDTNGVKRVICEHCFKIAEKWPFTFIGCHPMAGTQYSGFEHARTNMFHGAPMVVVAPSHMDDIERAECLRRLKELLEPCGFGSWTLTSAEEHDRMIAYTSQLAHIVSNAYVKSPQALRHKGFSAGSYKDLTRVARLNATMWTELFLDNADNLSAELSLIIARLEEYRDALDAHDEGRLHDLLAEGDRLKRQAEAQTSHPQQEGSS